MSSHGQTGTRQPANTAQAWSDTAGKAVATQIVPLCASVDRRRVPARADPIGGYARGGLRGRRSLGVVGAWGPAWRRSFLPGSTAPAGAPHAIPASCHRRFQPHKVQAGTGRPLGARYAWFSSSPTVMTLGWVLRAHSEPLAVVPDRGRTGVLVAGTVPLTSEVARDLGVRRAHRLAVDEGYRHDAAGGGGGDQYLGGPAQVRWR
jgi:hypothetical protein